MATNVESSKGIKQSYMLNKWIPLSLCRDAGIKLRAKYRDAATDRIAPAILESQEIFNQTFGMLGAIYIECHDEEIMRGREEARESSSSLSFPFPPPLTATVVAPVGVRSWRHPLIRDIPIMDAGLKGRQVRGFDSRIRSADTFDLRACSRSGFFSTSTAGDIKHRMGSIFVYSGILPRRVLPCGNDRVDFGPALLSLSPILFLASLLPCFPCSHLISLDSLRNDVFE